MNNPKPKLDPTKLTPEQRSQLSAYHQGQAQLQALKDIADMTGEVINLLDKQANQEGIDKLGVLLVDMRESLNQLNAKEAPEQPDTSKPVIDAISKLEKALTAAVSSQKAPIVNVPKADAPVVNVDAPDLSKVEKILKTDLPKAFEQAIQGIVIPEQDDTATNELLGSIYEQLASIDTAVRMQPQAPTTISVTNPDGSSIGSLSGSTAYEGRNDTTTDTNLVYLGKALPGSATSDAAWQIKRYNKSAGHMSFADDVTTFTKVWDNRTSYSY